jgi:pyruvate/2-oxoglutarate dehydrogenase complex dihydrolipoamide acyltransferase (E2) component
MGPVGNAHNTSATPEEVLREAANTGKSPDEVAKKWGVPVPVGPAAGPVSPYYTGPKPEEVAREAANTGESLKATAKRLGAPVPASTNESQPYPPGDVERFRTQPTPPQPPSTPKAKAPSAPKEAKEADGSPAATEAAIRHADALGVDLGTVIPEGDKITKADVTAHAATQATTSSSGNAEGTADTSTVGASTGEAST